MRATLSVLLGFVLLAAVAVRAQDAHAYRPGTGVSAPTLVKEVKPNYPPDPKARKLQGTVLMETIVLADGTVGDVTVKRSFAPEYGFDAEAVKAAKQWRFTPGMRDGTPVAVIVTIEIAFTPRQN